MSKHEQTMGIQLKVQYLCSLVKVLTSSSEAFLFDSYTQSFFLPYVLDLFGSVWDSFGDSFGDCLGFVWLLIIHLVGFVLYIVFVLFKSLTTH